MTESSLFVCKHSCYEGTATHFYFYIALTLLIRFGILEFTTISVLLCSSEDYFSHYRLIIMPQYLIFVF